MSFVLTTPLRTSTAVHIHTLLSVDVIPFHKSIYEIFMYFTFVSVSCLSDFQHTKLNEHRQKIINLKYNTCVHDGLF